MGCRTLIFDESGNLGSSGRYFAIACVDTNEPRPLHIVMKKAILKARNKFPNLNKHTVELKANEAYPCVKHYILEKIISKDVRISYVVADLKYVKSEMLRDTNLLYNFLMKILIDNIISSNYKNKEVKIICDKKTIKVNSKNSFEDYIKLHLNYDRGLDLNISVEYRDSNARDAYIVQAADYLANTIYSYYEYKNDTSKILFGIINKKLMKKVEFPKGNFGH